jgi:hypothetical protein
MMHKTKYRDESVTASTAKPGKLSTGHAANNSLLPLSSKRISHNLSPPGT